MAHGKKMRRAIATAVLLVASLAEAHARSRREKDRDKAFSLTFENPYAEAREIFWIGGDDPASMGTIAAGETRSVTTYEGHAFGWRQLVEAETCAEGATCAAAEIDRGQMEGTVRAARGMELHVLGDEPPDFSAADEEREEERDDPFEATFANRAGYAMRLTSATDASRTVEIDAGQRETMLVRRGEEYDWTRDGELLYRSVVEFYGQRTHHFRDEVYTRLCSEKTPKSEPVITRTYRDELDQRDITVEILREEPLIAYLRNWTKPGDCADMESRVRRTGLSDAVVSGSRAVVVDRRALSANLYWSEHNATSVTNRLIRRAFRLATDLRGYAVDPGPHQEPLNFIQYARGGEYRPHCDGVCHRAKYARGGRVATLIHYCRAPESGGGTVFPAAGLKIQPEVDGAVLFAYKRDDGYMDDGNTLHTGCLVRGGVKQIVTMWMREDVNEEEHWDEFDS